MDEVANVAACLAQQGLPWTVRDAVLIHLTQYDRLADATDTLATNEGYLELSWDGAVTFCWSYYDHDVDAEWLEDGGSWETRPSVPAPPELRRRLQTLTRRFGVPCGLHVDIDTAPWCTAFREAYVGWLVGHV
jgi:hypothetical protein